MLPWELSVCSETLHSTQNLWATLCVCFGLRAKCLFWATLHSPLVLIDDDQKSSPDIFHLLLFRSFTAVLTLLLICACIHVPLSTLRLVFSFSFSYYWYWPGYGTTNQVYRKQPIKLYHFVFCIKSTIVVQIILFLLRSQYKSLQNFNLCCNVIRFYLLGTWGLKTQLHLGEHPYLI